MVKVFKDIFTDHELASDSYKPEPQFEGVIFGVKSQYIEVVDDCGIPNNDDEGAGGDGPTRVNNIAHSFNLTETTYSKSEYMTWAKGYMKKLLGKLEEKTYPSDEEKTKKVGTFKAEAQKFIKYVLENISNVTFYINSEMDDEGMVIPAVWPENAGENEGPTFLYFADGVKEEKY